MNQKRAREFFNSNRLDALILKSGDVVQQTNPNLFYFLGAEIDNAALLIKRDGEPKLFVKEMNLEYAKEETGISVERYKSGELWEKVAKEARKCKRIGIEKERISAAAFESMAGKLGKKLVDVSHKLLEQRAVKDEKEIESIRKAMKLIRKIAGGFEICEGESELEIENNIQKQILDAGSEISFKPIVLAGENSRFPHGKPTARRVKKGEVVLADFGAKIDNYCSDMTRCFFVGRGSREQEEAYEKMKGIFGNLASRIKAGMPASDVAKLAEEEFGSYRQMHSIGHGIGLEVHESPLLTEASVQKMENNMVFTIEPGYYAKNFGVRYEDILLLRGRAARI